MCRVLTSQASRSGMVSRASLSPFCGLRGTFFQAAPACILALAATIIVAPRPASAQLPVPNPYAWYQASSLGSQGLNDGDSVTTWTDQSANHNDLFTFSGNPTYAASGLNGHPAVFIDSDGNGDSMSTNGNFTAGLQANSVDNGDGTFSPNLTIFVVYNDTTDPSEESHAFQFGNGNGPLQAVMMGKVDGVAGIPFGFGANLHSSYSGPFDSPPIIESFRYTGGTDLSTLSASAFKVNGDAVYTDGPSGVISLDPTDNGGPDSANDAWVGFSDGINSSGLTGNVAEIIVYNSVLSDAQEGAVGTYLSQEYGLTTDYAPPNYWTGAHNGDWSDAANWSLAIPGSTGTTDNADTALFSQAVSHTTVSIDAGRNIGNIVFDTDQVSSMIIGTTTGNALMLSADVACRSPRPPQLSIRKRLTPRSCSKGTTCSPAIPQPTRPRSRSAAPSLRRQPAA